MNVKTIPLDEVTVGPRYREDYGDLEALAQSIYEVGLLQPIGITQANELVFGARRLRACRILQWTTIPTHVLDFDSILLGQYSENEFRKEFTKSERTAIAKAVVEELGNRQGQRTDKQHQDNCPEVKGKQTREIAAKRAGFHSEQEFRRAADVVELGAPELVDAMDKNEISTSAAATIARTMPKEKQADVVRMPKAQRRRAVMTAQAKLRDESELRFYGIKRVIHDLAMTAYSPVEFWSLVAHFSVRDAWEDIDRAMNFLKALKDGHPNASKRPQRLS